MRWSEPLQNVERALITLESFSATSAPSKLERAGIVQAFEFTFEVFWKLFKKVGDSEGAIVASPKTAIAFAFAKRWLGTDQDLWLAMLDDRNLTSNLYREEIAQAVYEAIVGHYVVAFRAAYAIVEKELMA